jgi:hypothetical protein
MREKIVPEIVVHAHTLDSVSARQPSAPLEWRSTSVDYRRTLQAQSNNAPRRNRCVE